MYSLNIFAQKGPFLVFISVSLAPLPSQGASSLRVTLLVHQLTFIYLTNTFQTLNAHHNKVRVPISSTSPHPYIPYGLLPLLPPSALPHLSWLLQKHALKQDTLLLSRPSTLPYLLAASYAEAVNLKFFHTQVRTARAGGVRCQPRIDEGYDTPHYHLLLSCETSLSASTTTFKKQYISAHRSPFF